MIKNYNIDISFSDKYDYLESLVSYHCNNNRDSDKSYNSEANLYKTFFNTIVAKEVIERLKIDPNTARRFHKDTWKNCELDSYNPDKNDYVKVYIKNLFDLVIEHIEETNSALNKKGLKLEEIAFNNIFTIEGDKLSEIKRRWSFIWNIIADLSDESRKVFLYKLYGNLSFSSISKIMNQKESEIRSIYLEAENKIFNDHRFKEYFLGDNI